MDCIFCKIRDKEIPSSILFENEKAFAILDINPMNYGHVLLISKGHYSDILEIPENDLKEILSAVQQVSKALVGAFSLEGFNLVANKGEIAGQSIFHFHFHIIPRYKNDNLNFVRNIKKYEENQFNEYADQIRNAIQSLK
ncbi:MAG: HIT family protein [Ignavibacteria bacterium]|nr:HIT family protein [Bacteroidota bacterium]MSQ45697.1 HIT family protein [Ignavibacteria bacterium]